MEARWAYHGPLQDQECKYPIPEEPFQIALKSSKFDMITDLVFQNNKELLNTRKQIMQDL